jgi:hypothetical protein
VCMSFSSRESCCIRNWKLNHLTCSRSQATQAVYELIFIPSQLADAIVTLSCYHCKNCRWQCVRMSSSNCTRAVHGKLVLCFDRSA